MIKPADFDDLQSYSVALLGPLLNTYFAALYQRVEATEAPFVAFVSREGVFLHAAFEAFCSERGLSVACAPIPASRAFLSKLLLDDGVLQQAAKSKFSGSLGKFLEDRFALSDWGADPVTESWCRSFIELPGDRDMVVQLWDRIKTQVAPNIASKKAAYRQHLTSLGFTEGSIVADVGYSGSLQALLAWIMEMPVHSFYVATTVDQKTYGRGSPGRFEGLFDRIGTIGDGPALLDNSLLLEVIMSADHGQVDDYTETPGGGDWIFRHGPNGQSQYGHGILTIMQQAVIQDIRSSAHVSLEDLVSTDRTDWLFQYVNRMMSFPTMAPRLLMEVGDADDRTSGLGFINPWRYLPRFA